MPFFFALRQNGIDLLGRDAKRWGISPLHIPAPVIIMYVYVISAKGGFVESYELESIQNEICDEDVAAAVRDLKLGVTLTAEDLQKIYAVALRHAQARCASSMRVRDAMTRDVLSVSKFDDISLAVKLLSEKNISGLPVVDRESRVVGIISEADVVSMVGSRRAHTFKEILRSIVGHPLPERKMGHLVGDIMTSPAITVYLDTEISEAVRIMDGRRIRRLPVVDKYERLIGLISRSDIVKAMGKKLSGGAPDSANQ
ncbi:MAG TPA: CBS domain-containing protein [Thermodesulfovibrionales bacterium]|nr:CBS domain-containing protein [Thermodesulfovibrionales bacterium]